MARKFRSLLLAAVLLVSFAVPSGSAYADGYAGVVYGPKPTAVVNPDYGVIVNAGSSYDAALYAIGYDPDSSEFTSDVKAYLSNSDTGGAFYTFAAKFTNHNDKWGDGGFAGSDGTNVGVNDFDLNMTTSLKMFNSMYGPSNVWCGQYSAAERVAAVASVGLVLAGGVTGGGGSGGESDDGYYVFSGNTLSQGSSGASSYSAGYFSLGTSNKYSYYAKYIDNPSYDNGFEIGPRTLTFRVPKSAMAQFETIYPSSEYDWILDVTYRNGAFTYAHLQCYSQLTYKEGYTPFTDYSGISRADLSVNRRYTWQFTSTDQAAMTYDNNVVTFANDGDANRFTGANYSSSYVSFSTEIAAPLISVETPTPPTNWPEPDPPSTPDPPEVDPPTTPDPPNVPVSPTPPTYPPEVTYPDVTYVEADLTAVLDALNEHCEHLQHAIYTASSNLYSSLSSAISGEFTSLKTFLRALASWNVDAINDNFDALYTYLTDFAVWLEGCIRADDIVLLLEGIYNTMGNLDASTNDLVDLSALESGVSDISADVELIVQALNNLQDDNDLLTIRGYLKGMYDWLHDFVIPDPVSVDLSNVEGYLSDISTDLDDFVHDFAVRWADLMNELDDIITAINNINFSERRWWKPIDIPDDPTVIVPVIRLPPEYYDPTNPRLPPFIEEPDAINIPALQAAFMELMTKFPFCMLNDLLNMLLYVVRPAAAPIFDLPVPNPSDWSSPHMITIDLSIFDPCAAMLRMGITLWVGVKLARRSVKMWTADNQEVVTV